MSVAKETSPIFADPRPSTRQVAAFLGKLPLLDGAPAELINSLASYARVIHFEREERIFGEGDEADAFFVVYRGWVKVLRETPTGRSVLFDLSGPGEILGAASLADGQTRPVTALAAAPTEVLAIPRSTFEQFLQRHPHLWMGYAREITAQLREALDWQMQIVLGVEARMARLFLRLAERLGEHRRGRVVLPRLLTRQEIAEMTGTTPETAIRVLSRWKRRHLMATEKREFVIESVTTLGRLAQQEGRARPLRSAEAQPAA